MKKKVLLFAPFFTPSIKGGGPIVSTKNIIENLSEKIDFYVLTSDRDLGDKVPFMDITTNVWNQVGNANVMYVDSKNITFHFLKSIMKSEAFDYFYMNSFFNFRFSILPILTKKIFKSINGRLVVAPRGEFSPGALKLKAAKKKVYINFFKQLNIHKMVTWHATAESEKEDIENAFGHHNDIRVATNLTANYSKLVYEKSIGKKIGEVKLVFISRIHPKKNLLQALNFISQVRGNVDFSIYGPIEDKNYWEKCQEIIKALPSAIKVTYNGLLNHEEIIPTFTNNHFFLFPTYGENYGHVISEALIGGCPVIISDQTPWRNLEEVNVGWDVPLMQEEKFITILQTCVDMDETSYWQLSKSAFEYGKEKTNRSEDVEDNLSLFE